MTPIGKVISADADDCMKQPSPRITMLSSHMGRSEHWKSYHFFKMTMCLPYVEYCLQLKFPACRSLCWFQFSYALFGQRISWFYSKSRMTAKFLSLACSIWDHAQRLISSLRASLLWMTFDVKERFLMKWSTQWRSLLRHRRSSINKYFVRFLFQLTSP